ncbi:MAG TPA: autoinducer-2 kinase [Spirochaetia bacterium]|nr:autoinducer-2 kinase [Spirochaetia bacterium]
MAQKYLMAIDAGTGSVRAVLFDFDGNQIGCVQREWTHTEDPRWPGSMDFDWVHNWELASSCIREVLSKNKIDPEDVAAVCTTCMREGIVLYDQSGQEIWACANVDARSDDEVVELKRMNPALEKEIYLISGQTYALSALPRLLWVKNKMPEIYNKIAVLGMFNDWLIYKLTGKMAVEPSNGSTSGLFDLQKRTWEPAIARKCNIRDDIFPPVAECGTVLASVNERGSRETGLAVGTPVVVGGGDCQLGTIGVGAVDVNQAAVFGGSFWQYEFNTDSGRTDPDCRVRVNCHALPDKWQYEALAFKPGLVMRWFRDGFCQLEKQIAQEQGIDPYQLLDIEAEKVPVGSHGMLCCFSDVMNFIQWKHASPTFTNFEIDADRFNRYTFYRAILENTAMLTKGHMDLVQESTGNLPEEIIFAGGAAKSSLWCQILSDVMGLPVKVPVVKEATALGAAILAGHGISLYGSIPEIAKKIVKIERTFFPDTKNHKIYEKIYSIWREVYQAQLTLSNKGLTRNMWKAPGV